MTVQGQEVVMTQVVYDGQMPLFCDVKDHELEVIVSAKVR